MINKDKNVNLQLTISKNDYDNLLAIQEKLSNESGFNLSKSQVVKILINRYQAESVIINKEKLTATNKNDRRINDEKIKDYQAQVIALKDKLGVSYPRLSQLIGIPTSTLKKYANGTQQPKGDNETLLKQAFIKYAIK